jgi:hypothetical protein
MTPLLQVLLLLGAVAIAEYFGYRFQEARPKLFRESRTPVEQARAPRLELLGTVAILGALAALSLHQIWLPSGYVLALAAILGVLGLGFVLRAGQPRARTRHLVAIAAGGSTIFALLVSLGARTEAERLIWLLVASVMALATLRTIRRIRARKPAP